jgi:hypothetical protein
MYLKHKLFEYIFLLLVVFVLSLIFKVSVNAATFSFSPSSKSFSSGCASSVNVEIDATGQSSNSADIEIHYNPAAITIIDSNPTIEGKQILTGNAFETYAGNQVDENSGIIRLTGLSFSNYLTSRKIFATVNFIGSNTGTTATFNIRFDGVNATLDSNIADSQTSLDLLSGITNGTYTFTESTCNFDVTPPIIQFNSPQNGQVGVITNIVELTINDDQSGVDINSVQIYIDGKIYTLTSPEFSFMGEAPSFSIKLTLQGPFTPDQTSIITVLAKDFSGNLTNNQISFNVPSGEIVTPPLECPIIEEQLSLTEFITNNNQGKEVLKGTFLEDSIIEDVIDNTGIFGTGALIAGLYLLLNFLPLITLLNAPGLLLNMIALLLGKRTKRPWGIIVDYITGKPIAFATCRLYLSGTLSAIGQTVSDLEGRYGFSITPGSYRLEISHNEYSHYIEEIMVREDEVGYVSDVKLIPLDSHIKTTISTKLLLKKLFKKVRKMTVAFYWIGAIFSIISIIILPNLLNFIIFGIYCLILFITQLRKSLQKDRYASVVDSKTNLRIPYAIVKIFDLVSWKLVDTVTTNQNGSFNFVGEPKEYGVIIAIRGYEFPSKLKQNYPIIKDKYSGMLRVFLGKGNKKIQLYVDSIEQKEFSSNVQKEATNNLNSTNNLKSPFE